MTSKRKTSSEAAPATAAARTSPPTLTTKGLAKNDANHLLQKSNLRLLRLPSMKSMKVEFEQLAREAAQANQTFEQHRLRLTELEVSARATIA